MMMLVRFFAVASVWLAVSEGFVPLVGHRCTWGGRISPRLFAASESDAYEIDNDFKTFLTQCSLQTFMFLLRSLGDRHTALWLEGFTHPAIVRKQTSHPNVTLIVDARMLDEDEGEEEEDDDEGEGEEEPSSDQEEEEDELPKENLMLLYHGLHAINTTLFPTWDTYFEQLLQQPTETLIIESDEAHIPEYELDIDPASLCSRILSVREQISREFVKDLQVIGTMGGKTLEGYWENLREMQANNETSMDFQRENLLFLELNAADEQSDYAPSPLRKGNFDLLVLLATQESIHRVLQDRQEGPESVTNDFLRTFYEERKHYFSGPQRYGRSDDFLEELLSSPPRMITVEKGVTSLVDPMRLAELIVEAREQVAMEWKQVAVESPKEHMEIQRMRLSRMMEDVEVDAEEFFQ